MFVHRDGMHVGRETVRPVGQPEAKLLCVHHVLQYSKNNCWSCWTTGAGFKRRRPDAFMHTFTGVRATAALNSALCSMSRKNRACG